MASVPELATKTRSIPVIFARASASFSCQGIRDQVGCVHELAGLLRDHTGHFRVGMAQSANSQPG